MHYQNNNSLEPLLGHRPHPISLLTQPCPPNHATIHLFHHRTSHLFNRRPPLHSFIHSLHRYISHSSYVPFSPPPHFPFIRSMFHSLLLSPCLSHLVNCCSIHLFHQHLSLLELLIHSFIHCIATIPVIPPLLQ